MTYIQKLTNEAAYNLILGWYVAEPGFNKQEGVAAAGTHFPPKEGQEFDLDLWGVDLRVRDGQWWIVSTDLEEWV